LDFSQFCSIMVSLLSSEREQFCDTEMLLLPVHPCPQASSLSSTAFKRLTRELLQLQASPPEGIRVVLDEHDMLQVVGWIEG
jgi:hypothetical protein